MFKKFQQKVQKILENSVFTALGTPEMALYSPENPVSGDNYSPNYHIRPKLLSKKITRRDFPENSVFLTGKKKNKQKTKNKYGKSK
jgi:hypothetical protein